jgi:hypothetical protein
LADDGVLAQMAAEREGAGPCRSCENRIQRNVGRIPNAIRVRASAVHGRVEQTFFYAHAYGREGTENSGSNRRTFIVYPGSADSIGHRLRVQDDLGAHAASIRALGLDVHGALDWTDGIGREEGPLREVLESTGQVAS